MTTTNKTTTTKARLAAMTPAIIKMMEDGGPIYARVQRLFYDRYGSIPSAGSVHAALARLGMARKEKGYKARATAGVLYQRTKYGEYRLIQIAPGMWAPEHVAVAISAGLGWFPGCVVHHRNKNTLDNRQENLEIMSRSDHSRLHQTERMADPERRAHIGKKVRAAAARRRLAIKILSTEITDNGEAA